MTRFDAIRQMTDDELVSLLTWGRTFVPDIDPPDCSEICEEFRCGCALDCPHEKRYLYMLFRFMLRRNGTVQFRNPKIEIGNKATDWSPAPEDKQDKIIGIEGQFVGFDANGDAHAVDMEIGVTQLLRGTNDAKKLVSNGLWRNGTWQQSITLPDSGKNRRFTIRIEK